MYRLLSPSSETPTMAAVSRRVFLLLLLAVAGGLSLPSQQARPWSGQEAADDVPAGRGEDEDPDSMVPQIPLPAAAYEGDGHGRIDPPDQEPADGYSAVKSPLPSAPSDDRMVGYQPVPKEDLFTRESLAEDHDKVRGMQDSFLADTDRDEETQVAEYPIGEGPWSKERGAELKTPRREPSVHDKDEDDDNEGLRYDPFDDYLPLSRDGSPQTGPQEADDSHEQNLEMASAEKVSDLGDANDRGGPEENVGGYEFQDELFDKNYID